MWRELIDFAGRAFGFERRLAKNARDIEALEEQVRLLNSGFERLVYEMQRLRDELQSFKRDETNEREKLMLRLQVALLEQERRLSPPGSSKEQSHS